MGEGTGSIFWLISIYPEQDWRKRGALALILAYSIVMGITP